MGADIPFCIRGGCVRATGIGEIFEEAESLVGFVPVIAMGKQGSSTPLAYKAIDEAGYRSVGDALPMLSALEKKDARAVTGALYNAFEQVILPANPEAARLKALFLEQGAAGALMSGSGAAVFGLFEEERAARQSCDALRAAGYFAVVAPVIREAN